MIFIVKRRERTAVLQDAHWLGLRRGLRSSLLKRSCCECLELVTELDCRPLWRKIRRAQSILCHRGINLMDPRLPLPQRHVLLEHLSILNAPYLLHITGKLLHSLWRGYLTLRIKHVNGLSLSVVERCYLRRLTELLLVRNEILNFHVWLWLESTRRYVIVGRFVTLGVGRLRICVTCKS